LYAETGSARASKILIAARYAGVQLEVPTFKLGVDDKSAEFVKSSPLGKHPLLVTSGGSIFEDNAIARYGLFSYLMFLIHFVISCSFEHCFWFVWCYTIRARANRSILGFGCS